MKKILYKNNHNSKLCNNVFIEIRPSSFDFQLNSVYEIVYDDCVIMYCECIYICKLIPLSKIDDNYLMLSTGKPINEAKQMYESIDTETFDVLILKKVK